MTQQEFEAKTAESAALAQELLIKIQLLARRGDSFSSLLRQYILLRFMLDEAECTGENIVSWAQQSVEKIAGLKKGGLEISDRSGSCAAISSALTKKILLLITLQKALNITFPKEVTAKIQTVSQLEETILSLMAG